MSHEAPARTPVPAPDDAVELISQQCARCRATFEMEPTSEPGTIPELWMCANCRVALLGRPTSMVKHPS